MCFRVKSQYQAAVKRISELQEQQQHAMSTAQQRQLALHHKEAELVAAKQSVRSAVTDYMKSVPASKTPGAHSYTAETA